MIAASIALIGFGLDSVIDVTSAAAVAWQFAARSAERIEGRERTTLRVIAWSSFALAAYVVLESRGLTRPAGTGTTMPGVVSGRPGPACWPARSLTTRARAPDASR